MTRASRTTAFLAFLPVLLHGVAFARNVRRAEFFRFRTFDTVVLACLGVYLALTFVVLRNRDLSRKFVLLVYSILIPVVLLELLAGTYRGEALPWPPMQRVSRAADTMPGIEGEIRFTINERGVRAPDVWPAARADRILCVGGSTTECLYVTDEKSWPWLLGTRLSERLGRPILVANAGRSGHFTLHHLYQLRHYEHIDDFGVIVITCGINDAGALLRDNYESRSAKVPKEALGLPVKEAAYYRNSFLVRTLQALFAPPEPDSAQVVQDGAGEWYTTLRQRRRDHLANGPITTAPVGLAASLASYRANLVAILELCASRRQKLVFVTQPTLYRKDMPDDLTALLWQYTDRGAHTPEVLAQVNSAYNDALRAVCREFKIDLVDLAAHLPKDTSVFYDDCHFNVGGCDSVATFLAEHLAPSLRK